MDRQKKSINPLLIGGILVALAMIILAVISLMSIFRTNPYGNEIRIDNLTKEYPDLPRERQDLIYNQLYDMVAENLSSEAESEIPKSGALVREGSAEANYDSETKIHYGNFIVDIEAVKQSYRVQFEWSGVSNNQELGGYPAIVLCLPEYLQIYDNVGKCRNAFAEVYSWQNEFQIDYSFGGNTSYKIRKVVGDYLYNDAGAYFVNIAVGDGSLTKLNVQSGIAYAFDVITDGLATYNVITRVDDLYGKKYIAILLSGESIGKVAFLLTDSTNYVNELSGWLRNMAGSGELEIIVKGLEVK